MQLISNRLFSHTVVTYIGNIPCVASTINMYLYLAIAISIK